MDARSLVRRQIAEMELPPAKYDRRQPRLDSVFVILLEYNVVDSEGQILPCRTFTTGATIDGSIEEWRHDHPWIGHRKLTHTVLHERRDRPKESSDYRFMGERVEPTVDMMTAYLQATA